MSHGREGTFTVCSLPSLLSSACFHPICKSQSVTQYPTWYSRGPSITYIPLPIPDPWVDHIVSNAKVPAMAIS